MPAMTNSVEIKVETEIYVSVTPELLAKAFWEMNSEQQAAFFNALGEEVFKKHTMDDFRGQMVSVEDCGKLTVKGELIIANIDQKL